MMTIFFRKRELFRKATNVRGAGARAAPRVRRRRTMMKKERKMKEKIVLIPFVDEFIVKINYDLSKIDMILPDGLLDI